MAEIFSNLWKKTEIQVQEAQSFQQNEPKEIHMKTCCNQNCKS